MTHFLLLWDVSIRYWVQWFCMSIKLNTWNKNESLKKRQQNVQNLRRMVKCNIVLHKLWNNEDSDLDQNCCKMYNNLLWITLLNEFRVFPIVSSFEKKNIFLLFFSSLVMGIFHLHENLVFACDNNFSIFFSSTTDKPVSFFVLSEIVWFFYFAW